MFERKPQKRVATVQIQLPADVRAVIVNRARVDEKHLADLPARFVVGNQLQNAAFGSCQRIQAAGLLFERGAFSAAVEKKIA